MKRLISLLFMLLILSGTKLAQAQVGINTDDPDNSAILHIRSDSKGVLFPTPAIRQDMAKKNGLFYYDEDEGKYYYYDSTKGNWQCINPFNASDSSKIEASQDLNVGDDLDVGDTLDVGNNLTVNNNATISNNLTVTNKLAVNKENTTIKSNTVEVTNGDLIVTKKPGNTIQGYGTVPKGAIVPWYGNKKDKFTDNGKGKGDLKGWAICNGKNETPDLRNRFIRAQSDGKLHNENELDKDSLCYRSRKKFNPNLPGCETTKFIYIYKVTCTGPGKKTVTVKLEGNSSFHKTKICNEVDAFNCDTCAYAITREDTIKNNPNYYKDNKDCKNDDYAELKYFDLLFIMRTE